MIWLTAWLVQAALQQHPGHGTPAAAPPAENTPSVATSAEAQAAPAQVTLRPGDITRLGIRTQAARVVSFERTIRAVAVVTADERRVAHVHTRFSGYVERLHASFVGQKVKKGEPLAEIFSPELLATQQEWITALNLVDEARKRGVPETELRSRQALANAAAQRLTVLDVPRGVMDAVRVTRQPRRTITLESPLAGTIIRKQAVQGLFIGPDVHLFEVADLSRVWVVADVYAHELEDVRVGGHATFTPDAGAKVWTGAVEFVAPTVNPATRTVSIRVTYDNTTGMLRPGDYGTLSILAPGKPGVAVPETAVLLTGQRSVVFVRTAENSFAARTVVTGRRVPGLVEVRSGLQDREEVVVSAQFVLDAETQLNSTAGGAGTHQGH